MPATGPGEPDQILDELEERRRAAEEAERQRTASQSEAQRAEAARRAALARRDGLVLAEDDGVAGFPPARPITGRFAYGAPSVMIVEQPYFLSVSIAAPKPGETTPQLDARLAQDTRDTLGADAPTAIRSGDVRLGAVMTASLTGDAFTITELSEARQQVDPTGVTRWLWEVRGQAAGRSSLVMRLTINGENGEPDQVVRVVPSAIDVRKEADAFLNRDQMATRASPADSSLARGAPSGGTSLVAPTSTPSSARSAASCTTTGPATSKLALVIGNESYTGITRLSHARSDGAAIRDVLRETGFRVTHCEDLGADDMAAALDAFRAQVKAASANGEVSAAFYYAGHGASTATQNETYLLPVSIRQASIAQIESQGVSVGQIVGGLSKAGARRLVVVIDACRDLLDVPDGDYRGFHVLNWRSSAFDIVAYATMWGEKARDNGVYARTLASTIRAMPGADIAQILNKVQTDVALATDEDQVPQYNDRMPGVFALN